MFVGFDSSTLNAWLITLLSFYALLRPSQDRRKDVAAMKESEEGVRGGGIFLVKLVR